MKKRSILLLILCLNVLTIFGQRKKDDEDITPQFVGEVNYTLPKTSVRVEIEVEESYLYSGPYTEYAEQFLGIKNSPKSDSHSCKITNVEMTPFGEADQTKVYSAKGAIAAALSLTEGGSIIGINSISTYTPREYKSTAFVNNFTPPSEPWTNLSTYSYEAPDSIANAGLKLLSKSEIAEEVAITILKLRRAKVDALILDVDELFPDGEAYKVVFKEYDNLEKKYLELFTGKVISKKHKYIFDASLDSKGEILFKFSNTYGVMPSTDSAGDAMILQLIPDAGAKATTNTPAGSEGLYYRVPATGTARLINSVNGRVLAQISLDVAQLGSVKPISSSLLDGSYSITLHPVTGAISKVEKRD